MRAVEVGDDRRLSVVDVECAAPAAGEVTVDVAFCGICGSDLHFRDVPELFPAGTVPGHELSGSVSALGSDVDGWSDGDRVAVLPFASCGDCDACRRGDEHVCGDAIAKGVGLGSGRPGAYAERVVVDERMLFALPDEVDDRAGTLVEPTAVAIHAVRRVRPQRGQRIAVVGGGPIGLLTSLVAQGEGADVVLVARNPGRAEVAASLGIATVAPADAASALADDPPSAVFECVGTGEALALCAQLVAPLGTVVIVGVAPEPFPLDPLPVIFKELDVRGSFIYRRTDFQAAIDLLASGRIPTEKLISDVVGLDDAEETFRSLTSPGNDRVKVLLNPSAT
jgi:(R,R)-butanediol dehydrogenase / meso-butanediol dehydrogenase / diacetyl reductase